MATVAVAGLIIDVGGRRTCVIRLEQRQQIGVADMIGNGMNIARPDPGVPFPVPAARIMGRQRQQAGVDLRP